MTECDFSLGKIRVNVLISKENFVYRLINARFWACQFDSIKSKAKVKSSLKLKDSNLTTDQTLLLRKA